ncbi:MAG TPA: WYL domain-containing protein [Kineosporiaceae bacterium]|nr:WYL domain-containing protein [Kineosporiaceae bacterium]
MSSRRTERLLNLVICLLATRRWLTKEQIRLAVPQYADCDSTEAFDRMFERDKEDLRDLGVPVVTGTDQRWFDDETGYRIDRDTYALPPIELDAEELAVVGLASRVWQQASLAGPAAQALTKLTALGVETDEGGPTGLEPRIRTAEPAFEPLYAATRDHQPVAFSYRKPTGETATREVEPWAVISRSGRWYLIGRDRQRDAARVFRLSRIDSNVRRVGRAGQYVVPDDLDPHRVLGRMGPPEDERIAVVRVRSGRGAGLRRRALPELEGADARPAGEWEELRVKVGDAGGLAQELAGYGPDVVVLEPPDVRADVIRRLQAALAVQSAALPSAALPSAEPVT